MSRSYFGSNAATLRLCSSLQDGLLDLPSGSFRDRLVTSLSIYRLVNRIFNTQCRIVLWPWLVGECSAPQAWQDQIGPGPSATSTLPRCKVRQHTLILDTWPSCHCLFYCLPFSLSTPSATKRRGQINHSHAEPNVTRAKLWKPSRLGNTKSETSQEQKIWSNG